MVAVVVLFPKLHFCYFVESNNFKCFISLSILLKIFSILTWGTEGCAAPADTFIVLLEALFLHWQLRLFSLGSLKLLNQKVMCSSYNQRRQKQCHWSLLKYASSFEETIKNLYLRNKINRHFTNAKFSKMTTFQTGYSKQVVNFWQFIS